MKIAILGYGVVGSGVAEVLRLNGSRILKKTGHNIELKYVLDTRDLSGDPIEPFLAKNFEEIESDPEIKIVVESIGGETIAYDFVKRALLSGKSVCTPNKALMAKHGAELLAIAKQKDVSLLFEASVGGGIPLIRPFNDALLTDEILAISGIVNGTSNYILTQMSENGTSYSEALKAAQNLGYAEADPTADVGGFDACRKLSILLSLAVGKQVDYEDIKTVGIEKISAEDFSFASALGFTLKQLVNAKICENGVEALTAPFLVKLTHPLAAVNDVYNAVYITGKTTGDIMLYGSGAGKLPTASAVVSNIADAAVNRHIPYEWKSDKAKILPASGYVRSKVIRVLCSDEKAMLDAIKASNPQVKATTLANFPGHVAWITPPETDADTEKFIKSLNSVSGLKSVERVLLVY
ncbi:MAG: homoserine dehydrogenase [Defluviitaleaceae bacterium]|nr:homoserine dehydrogenase [Defluviitaleaceae bacterium]